MKRYLGIALLGILGIGCLAGCSNKRFDVFYIPERPIIEVSSILGTVKIRIVAFRIVDVAPSEGAGELPEPPELDPG